MGITCQLVRLDRGELEAVSAEPDLVRLVAGAPAGLDDAVLGHAAAVDAGDVGRCLDLMRGFSRRAAAERQAVAAIIG